MRSLVRTLVTKGSVGVSVTRAQEVRSFVGRLTTLARKKTLESHRKLVSILGGDEKTAKGLTDIASKLSRPDGSLRLIKLGTRRGDSSQRARLEWSKKPEKESKSKPALPAGRSKKADAKPKKNV